MARQSKMIQLASNVNTLYGLDSDGDLWRLVDRGESGTNTPYWQLVVAHIGSGRKQDERRA